MMNILLKDFFGYCLAEITIPDNIIKPLLLYKCLILNKTIFPIGTFKSVYFS